MPFVLGSRAGSSVETDLSANTSASANRPDRYKDGGEVMQQQSSASWFEPVCAISHNLGEYWFGFSEFPHRRLADDPTVQVGARVANLSVLTCRTLCPQSAC